MARRVYDVRHIAPLVRGRERRRAAMPWTKRRVHFGIPVAALALLWLTTTARATTDDWIPAGHLDAWSGLHTATRLADGRVLVAGGAASGGGATAAAE